MPTKKLKTNYPKRGEIFVADLSPSLGHEIHKKRPVLIISHNSLNQTLSTVVVLPFSSITPQFIGPDIVVFISQKGLDKKSALIVNQIRAIDKKRLVEKVGIISKIRMQEVEGALKIVLDFE